MKIAVITPISHLPDVNKLVESKGEVFYLEDNNKYQVRELLLKNKIDTILCNPNKQDYKIDAELLEGSNVTLINTCSTGMNHIDVNYCKRNNIEIFSLTKDLELIENLPSTSELAFGLMMSLLRKIPESINHVKDYKWDYLPYLGRQVMDLKIGIIGHGRLGRFMETFCRAFNAEVFIFDPYKDSSNINSIEDLFSICDVVSLHVHVNEETTKMINKKVLLCSNKSLFLINTSRGEIVNELDVIDALEKGVLSGYATDVIEDEFGNLENSPIIKGMNNGLNILVTPHTGGMTIEGQAKAYKWAINKL
jgi:D-3-phosphoglycerate dehydrogenase